MADDMDEGRFAPTNAIEGEIVESTERALSALSVNSGAATLDTSMVAILTRAELDQMVVTARANPRQVQQAMDATVQIACLNMKTATECGYALPRGRDDKSGKQNVITGPSVRLAEIVACQWGNCQAASRVTEVNRAEGWVEAEGVFIDFQTNYRVTARVRRSIRGKPFQGKPGKVFGDDMINVTSNAAAAIAFRNAVFKGVPKPIWDTAYDETQKRVRGDEKTLAARRVDLLLAFRDKLNITPEKVYAILGVKGEMDIGLDELVVAAGFFSALKNNEITVEDLIQRVASDPAAAASRSLAGANGPKPPPKANQVAGEAGVGASNGAATTKADPGKLQRTKPVKEEVAHDPETGEVTEKDKPTAPAAENQVQDDAEGDDDAASEETDQQPAQGEDGDEAAISVYLADIADLDSILDIVNAYEAFVESDEFSGADQVQAQIGTWEALKALQPDISPGMDPIVFEVWLASNPPMPEIKPAHRSVMRTPTYQKMKDSRKDDISLAVASALGEA